jgi:dolichol-phosphate mannosyltransferase
LTMGRASDILSGVRVEESISVRSIQHGSYVKEDSTAANPAPKNTVGSRPVRLSVLVPAYQEEATIGQVVAAVRTLSLAHLSVEQELIVVDDGSSDGTGREVERAAEGDPRVRLVRHKRNQGKGAAIRTALEHATGELSLVQDADLEYDISDYQLLLPPMLAGAPVVYGSRFLTNAWPAGMLIEHLIANRLLTYASNLLYRHRITDEATCLKVFRTDLLRSLQLECTGFEFCPEVTAKLGLRRVPIAEVPVHYRARSKVAGKKVRWTDGVEAISTLVKYRLRKIATGR